MSLSVAVIEPSHLQKLLSRQDISELFAIAEALFGSRRRKKCAMVKFVWREISLVARRTPERLIIEDQRQGEVCCRWEW